LIETALCPVSFSIATTQAVTSVASYPFVKFNFTASNVNLTLNLANPAQAKVIIDANGQTNIGLILTSGTDLPHGLELVDSAQNGATQLKIIATNAKAAFITFTSSTGADISGSITFTGLCHPAIYGTISQGDLNLNGVTWTDPLQVTDFQVLLSSGKATITNSNIGLRSFLLATGNNDATITCSGSQVVTTSSANSNLYSNTWSGVSVGLATVASSNSFAPTHLNLNSCVFSGNNRGYFNYFNRQYVTNGNVQVSGSTFTFGYKLRIRTGSNYTVGLAGSNFNMTSGSGDLTVGSGTPPNYGDPLSHVSITGSTLTSSNTLNVYGKDVTFANSNAVATGSVLVETYYSS